MAYGVGDRIRLRGDVQLTTETVVTDVAVETAFRDVVEVRPERTRLRGALYLAAGLEGTVRDAVPRDEAALAEWREAGYRARVAGGAAPPLPEGPRVYTVVFDNGFVLGGLSDDDFSGEAG